MKAWILHGPRDLRLEDVELDSNNLQPDEIWWKRTHLRCPPAPIAVITRVLSKCLALRAIRGGSVIVRPARS